jgi:hypothetical protein
MTVDRYGRPLLLPLPDIPGVFIHGSMVPPATLEIVTPAEGSPSPSEADDPAIAAADTRTITALLNWLAGEWTVDLEQTEFYSEVPIEGKPAQDILVTMAADGGFVVDAPSILGEVLGMQFDIGLRAEGRLQLDLDSSGVDLVVKATTVDVQFSEPRLTLSGPFQIDLSDLLKPALEFFEKMLTQEQELSLDIRNDVERVVLKTGDVTNVMTRPQGERRTRHLLPTPPYVPQPNDHTCWAAALSSFLQVLETPATSEQQGMHLQPQWTTMMAIIQAAFRLGPHAKLRYVADGKTKTPSGDLPESGTLIGAPLGDADWTAVLDEPSSIERTWRGMGLMLKIGVDLRFYEKLTLSYSDITALIDQNKYVLMCFTRKGWGNSMTRFWHCVVVYGYDRAFGHLLYVDPDAEHTNDPNVDRSVAIVAGRVTAFFDENSAYVIFAQTKGTGPRFDPRVTDLPEWHLTTVAQDLEIQGKQKKQGGSP